MPLSPVPTLDHLVELLHHATAAEPTPLLLRVAHHGADLAIAVAPVGPDVDHPADPLIGRLAPADWEAVGLATGVRTRPAPPAHPAGAWAGAPAVGPHPDEPGAESRLTVLVDRSGRFAAALDRGERDVELLSTTPSGWVADALLRTLGRPTPPPAESIGAWVEATWIDRLAAATLHRPGALRTWGAAARLHPLAPPSGVLPGPLLGVEVRALEAESSWARLRRLWAGAGLPSAPPGLPDAVPVALADWFDDGSFCRWVLRNLPPPEAVLPAVVDALPESVAAELVDALVTVGAPP